MGYDILPPLLLIHFLEMNVNRLIILWEKIILSWNGRSDVKELTDRPSAVFYLDVLTEFAFENLLLAFKTDT